MQIYKLLWLADRYSLRNFGYLLTDDEYYAMEHGPVGTKAKSLFDSILDESINKYREKHLKLDDGHTINLSSESDIEELSELDISTLRTVVAVYGSSSASQLRDYSHKFPEWERYKDKLETKNPEKKSYKIELNDFFKEPSHNLHKTIFNQSNERLSESKQVYKENTQLKNFFSS